MYKLEIEINDRVKKDLEDFISKRKASITKAHNTCSDFATASELGKDFTIYDDIELKLEELSDVQD